MNMRHLGAVFCVLAFALLGSPIRAEDTCNSPRRFVGTTEQGCVWNACNPESATGSCEFSNKALISSLETSEGLNFTSMGENLERCFNAGRVLLSMLSNNSAQSLQNRSLWQQSSASVPTGGILHHIPGDDEFDLVRRISSTLSNHPDSGSNADRAFTRHDRALLQTTTVTETSANISGVDSQVLTRVSQCPSVVPEGLQETDETRDILLFVAENCRNVPNVPATFVFGDVIQTSLELQVSTVCLPQNITRALYLPAAECLAQNPQPSCLEPVLRMWSVNATTAAAVADVDEIANRICLSGTASSGSESSLIAPSEPRPIVSRRDCLRDRSSAVDDIIAGVVPGMGRASEAVVSAAQRGTASLSVMLVAFATAPWIQHALCRC